MTPGPGASDSPAAEADQPLEAPRCPFCLTADRVRLADVVAPWWDARFFACGICGTEWATGPLFSDRRRVPRRDDA